MRSDEGLFGTAVSEYVILEDGGMGRVVDYIPFEFGSYGIVGWVCKEDSEKWEQVKFENNTFWVPDGFAGQKYCIKYFTAIIDKKVTINGHDFQASHNAITKKEDMNFKLIKIEKINGEENVDNEDLIGKVFNIEFLSIPGTELCVISGLKSLFTSPVEEISFGCKTEEGFGVKKNGTKYRFEWIGEN